MNIQMYQSSLHDFRPCFPTPTDWLTEEMLNGMNLAASMVSHVPRSLAGINHIVSVSVIFQILCQDEGFSLSSTPASLEGNFIKKDLS